MKYLIVLIFAIYFCAAQTPICAVDSDCNYLETQNKQYCDTTKTPAVCTVRASTTYKTSSALLAKGYCPDSIDFGSDATAHVCGSYQTAGCPVTLANVLYFTCIGNSTYSFAASACVATNSTTVYVGLNEKCNSTLICQDNLQCVASVCRPTLTIGANCVPSGGISCGTGLTCNGDRCVPQYQKIAGENCFVNAECLSGQCSSGRCLERSKETCYSNTQCNLGFSSVCGGTNGTCTVGSQFANSAYFRCVADTCTSTRIPGPNTICGCESQYVAAICASQCLNRVDLRKQTDGYSYDCTALKRTIIASNTCEIKATVLNCPTSSGAIQKLSLFMVMVILFFL
jgi:hypothetical protein